MNGIRTASTFKDLNTGTKITSRDEIDVLARTFALIPVAVLTSSRQSLYLEARYRLGRCPEANRCILATCPQNNANFCLSVEGTI